MVPKVKVLRTTRHGNKLKRGHLAGNRFTILLRDVAQENVKHAQATLEVLKRRGIPNWYDTQRFGRRLDTARLGLCLIRNDLEGYFRVLLGEPDRMLDPGTFEARKAYADGKLDEALNLWPRNANIERMALIAVKETGPGEKALRRVQQKLKLLHVSAAQSLLFNRCLERRFDELDRLWDGDLCEKENGAKFTVENAAIEQPRADGAPRFHPRARPRHQDDASAEGPRA